jgi:hypothetical protein
MWVLRKSKQILHKCSQCGVTALRQATQVVPQVALFVSVCVTKRRGNPQVGVTAILIVRGAKVTLTGRRVITLLCSNQSRNHEDNYNHFYWVLIDILEVSGR